jgi:hypothetical protein
MGWKCEKCGMKNDSDSLDFPMTHGFKCNGKVVPDVATAVRWGKLVGVVE